MPKHKIISNSTFLKAALISASLLVLAPTFGQDKPKTPTELETERLTAEAALAGAKAKLLEAELGIQKAKFTGLGLPQFENKTELATKGGEIEAAMLTSWAVRKAAAHIADDVKKISPSKNYLILTGTETFDFTLAESFKYQLKLIETAYDRAFQERDSLKAVAGYEILSVAAGAVSALKLATGLFGNEVKVTGIELASFDDAMLANAIAGNLPGKGLLPSKAMGVPNFASSGLYGRLQTLNNKRDQANEQIKEYGDKPTDDENKVIALFKEADAALTAFSKAATTPNDKGIAPLVTASLLEKIAPDDWIIVRVTVNSKGGSLINSKNIATTFGLDPIKVSGGLVVSYSMTNVADGLIQKSEIVTCQTTLASLRRIQTANWIAETKAGKVVVPSEESENRAICSSGE
jgi:hypothetical protein